MDLQSMPADWAQKIDERSSQAGLTLKISELFYTGERNPAGARLSSQGWTVSTLPTTEAYAANGFELPRTISWPSAAGTPVT